MIVDERTDLPLCDSECGTFNGMEKRDGRGQGNHRYPGDLFNLRLVGHGLKSIADAPGQEVEHIFQYGIPSAKLGARHL